MSRQLAIAIAFLKVPTDYKSDPMDTDAHLIAIDRETGKGVMMNLDRAGVMKWQPLPPVPVHLLGPIDCATCGGGDAHADNCPEMLKLEARSFAIMESDQCPFRLGGSYKGRSRCVLRNGHDGDHEWPADAFIVERQEDGTTVNIERQDDGLTPLHDERDLNDDVPFPEVRETAAEAEARRDHIRRAIVRGGIFDPERTLESDIKEDRH